MTKQHKNDRGQNADEEHVKDSNELLALIRRQMAERRTGPEERRPKELEISEPE